MTNGSVANINNNVTMDNSVLPALPEEEAALLAKLEEANR
jgi:hypothetical protein